MYYVTPRCVSQCGVLLYILRAVLGGSESVNAVLASMHVACLHTLLVRVESLNKPFTKNRKINTWAPSFFSQEPLFTPPLLWQHDSQLCVYVCSSLWVQKSLTIFSGRERPLHDPVGGLLVVV